MLEFTKLHLSHFTNAYDIMYVGELWCCNYLSTTIHAIIANATASRLVLTFSRSFIYVVQRWNVFYWNLIRKANLPETFKHYACHIYIMTACAVYIYCAFNACILPIRHVPCAHVCQSKPTRLNELRKFTCSWLSLCYSIHKYAKWEYGFVFMQYIFLFIYVGFVEEWAKFVLNGLSCKLF